ncbi:DUF6153 family protein [Streptomyces aquilus]|uniref:DUF6153 family protein n=1 Tax=Streptomyces aquilus TaxID=2548456 RepID=UPI00369DB5B1
MTGRGASTPRNRARQGVGRVVCAAVVAVIAALAVLAHHELSAPSTGPASASAGHVMTLGTTMPAHDTSAAGQVVVTAVPSAGEGHQAGCSETAVQHCSAAGVEVVKLRAPVRTPVLWNPPAPEAVATAPEAAGTVERAPPDLSVLSQLRI